MLVRWLEKSSVEPLVELIGGFAEPGLTMGQEVAGPLLKTLDDVASAIMDSYIF